MIEYFRELWHLIIGHRKPGAFDEPDERDYTTDKIKVSQILFPKGDGRMDLSANPAKDQGQTNFCTSYAMASLIESMLVRKLHRFIDVDPQQLINFQQNRRNGMVDSNDVWDIAEKGDTLQNALQAVIDNRIKFKDYDPDGKSITGYVTFHGYSKIDKDLKTMSEWLAKGHPTYTGSTCFDNYIDSAGYWQVSGKKRRGGHAFHIPKIWWYETLVWLLTPFMENTWGQKWNGNGEAPLNPNTIRKLMSTYILYGLEVK